MLTKRSAGGYLFATSGWTRGMLGKGLPQAIYRLIGLKRPLDPTSSDDVEEVHLPISDLFTIIIPTLNRCETLESAIRSCLEQDDPNFEVIVSDNASTDDTQAVLRSFTDARLKHIRAPARLGMSEHWEFALSHAESDFISFLGDDDAFLPGAIARARSLIKKFNVPSVTWQKVEYHWPNHIIPEFRNWFQIPLSDGCDLLKVTDVLPRVMMFHEGYDKLPCIYNSFVSTKLINGFRQHNHGLFFTGVAPDVFSSFAIASELSEYLFCHEPLSVNGASSKSNGTLQTVGEKTDQNALAFWRDTAFSLEPDLPECSIGEIVVVDAFLKVARRTARLSEELFNPVRVVQSAVASTFSGYVPRHRHEERQAAVSQFAARHGILSVFEESTAREQTNRKSSGLPPPGLKDQNLHFDASTLNIQTSYDAALRAEEILTCKREQRHRFQELLDTKHPPIAIAISARAKSGPLKLHLGCGQMHFDGYVNIDFPQAKHSVMYVRPDIFFDVIEIDMPKNSVDEVRLHHVFEHFNRTVAIALLVKWHRWLKPGGRLWIETPDFEASAQDFIVAETLERKLRAVRHLEGDQADAWAYHIGQWFPARFEKTLRLLGYEEIEIIREKSGHRPSLSNVTAKAKKRSERSKKQQYLAGCDLLKDFMVAKAEAPTWTVWKKQLASLLEDLDKPSISIEHPDA